MENFLRSISRPRLQCHLFLFLLFGPILLEAADVLYHICGSTGNFTANSTYGANLGSLLGSVSSGNSITYGFYNTSSGQGPDEANMIGLCRGDVGLSDCRACLNDSSIEIARRCPVQKEAAIWYENCILRYSNKSIFGTVDGGPVLYMWNVNNATSVPEFNKVLRDLMDGLRTRAAAGNSTLKFAAGNATAPDFKTLYGLTQCTPDLSEQQCNDCLVESISDIPQCCSGKVGGRLLGRSCNIRFEIYRFYDPSAEGVPPPSPAASPPAPATNTTGSTPPSTATTSKGSSSNTAVTIILVVVPIIAVCILVIVLYFCIRKVRKLPVVQTVDGITTAESLQYDFATIKTATEDFSDENKLGQGGFGSVYKGVLPSGQEIAVKRLSRGLGQGDQEFKNEVLLVARLQHRNLVRLLGFCLSGDERLLIYEFVPNASLDQFIFDPIKRHQLDWQRRQKVIGGIARGLVYLHEDSRLRIIHRDLKASNVLLDAEMAAKIADFGMARLFVVDETHAATDRIVGTYSGYMAPEYAMYGQFSQKSDVFSFGVLVLEIVSGQRNNNFRIRETVVDLLSFAWRSWREGTVANMIDPSLSDGPRTDIVRCIHIGLLCVQENAADRPNMASVLLMLNSFSISLPVPSQPALYMNSNIESSASYFANISNTAEISSVKSKSELHQGSVNEASITDMVPR